VLGGEHLAGRNHAIVIDIAASATTIAPPAARLENRQLRLAGDATRRPSRWLAPFRALIRTRNPATPPEARASQEDLAC
jgi:hypothetical protein